MHEFVNIINLKNIKDAILEVAMYRRERPSLSMAHILINIKKHNVEVGLY